MSLVSSHVGSRIKLYRKNKNITLKQFSEIIHKSVSTLSKYENGEISIDIETLFEIAEALNISPNQLIDYEKPKAQRKSLNAASSFFADGGSIYFYFYRQDIKKINRCVLEIKDDGDKHSAMCYVNISDMSNYHSCRFLYYGEMAHSDIYTNFSLENQVNPMEKLFLCVTNPIDKGDVAYGIISGISSKYLRPVSYKFILSKVILSENDELIEALTLSKEDIKTIKRTNSFMLAEIFS